MRNRKAASRSYWLMLLLFLCGSMNVQAYTAEELYEDCGVEYSSPYDEKDLETISDYNFAKRYVSMYRYVSVSTYDEEIIENRINECKKIVEEAEAALLDGYSKTTTEIYQLESDYKVALQKLHDAENVTKPVEIETKQITAEDVPTYNEYVRAMNRKKVTDINCNLGEQIKPTLAVQAYLVENYDDTSITYTTVQNGGVCSMFNGTVAAVGDDHVTVSHHNGIVSSYKGVTPTVSVGDTVIQNGPIGVTGGSFTVKLKVKDKLVNVYELLEGSDENLQN